MLIIGPRLFSQYWPSYPNQRRIIFHIINISQDSSVSISVVHTSSCTPTRRFVQRCVGSFFISLCGLVVLFQGWPNENRKSCSWKNSAIAGFECESYDYTAYTHHQLIQLESILIYIHPLFFSHFWNKSVKTQEFIFKIYFIPLLDVTNADILECSQSYILFVTSNTKQPILFSPIFSIIFLSMSSWFGSMKSFFSFQLLKLRKIRERNWRKQDWLFGSLMSRTRYKNWSTWLAYLKFEPLFC